MIKRKYYILGTLALLCLLGTGYYIGEIYNAHGRQVAEWNEGAKAAFEEALWMEVDKRSEIPIFHYSSEHPGMKTLNAKIPETVRMMTPEGFLTYKIERKKYDLSLIKDTERRGHLGALLEMYPLSIDTLLIQWDSLLANRQVPGRSLIRYIYTDWELRDDTICVPVDEKMVHSDSLITRYLGFRCEHELVGYVSHPSWLSGLSRSNWYWLIVIWGAFVILVISYSSIESLFQRKFVEEKIVEKEIYVADVHINKADVFRLPDGTLFDSFAKVLSKDGIQHNIQPQTASLLKLFLSKSDLKVTSEEICWGLWKAKREKDKLYSAIRRLRNDLKAVNSVLVVSCTDRVYELKSPISSNISD